MKEPPCPDPPKFNMKKGKDFRPYLEGCERYIRLKINRFQTEEAKILWALGFLEGDKAMTWARSYETRMYQDSYERYVDWGYFKAKLRKECDLAEEDVEATVKMTNLAYNNDIGAYIDQLQFLNERAMLTGGALKAAIRNGLPDRIIELMSYWDLNTPKTTWQALRKAGKSYEAAEQAKEAAHKWGAASSSSSGKKEDNNNKPPCNNSNNNRKRGKGKNKAKEKDEAAENTKPAKRYPKRFKTYEEANKGVPQELIFKRLKFRKCTRCGKGPHNALYCAGDAVTSDASTTSKPKDTKVAAASSTASASTSKEVKAEKSVSAVIIKARSLGFITEIDDRELDTWPISEHSSP